MEVTLGLGLQGASTKAGTYSYGPQPVWAQSLVVVPNALASFRLTPSIRSFGMRVTLEGRLRFASSDSEVVQNGAFVGFTDHFSAPFTLTLLLGGELPVSWSSP